MWNLKRNDTNKLTYKTETHRFRKRTHGCWWEGIVKDFGKVMYTLLYLKLITNKNILYSTRNTAQCYVPAWMGGMFGAECIHVCVWLSPFIVARQVLGLYMMLVPDKDVLEERVIGWIFIWYEGKWVLNRSLSLSCFIVHRSTPPLQWHPGLVGGLGCGLI